MGSCARAALAALAAAALAGCGGGHKAVSGADWRAGRKEIKLAINGNSDDPMMVQRRTAYRDHIAKATGLPVKLFESSDYNGVIQALSSGQVDIAQISGGGYANVDAQVGKLVTPLLTTRQAEGDTGYWSILVVRANSPYHKLQDLKGKSFGWVDYNSTSGYLYPRAKMREQGVDPDTFFGKTSFAGAHTQAVMALSNGQFEGTILAGNGGDPVHGFARTPMRTMARRGLLDPNEFRTIWAAGPIPNTVLAARTDRPQAMLDLVRGAMGALPYDEPDLWPDIGQLDGSTYTAVGRDHYKEVIALREQELAQRRGAGGRR